MKALEFLLGTFWVVACLALIFGVVDGTPNGDFLIKISIMPFSVISAFFLFFAVADRKRKL